LKSASIVNRCRNFALNHFSPKMITEKYRDLYAHAHRKTNSVGRSDATNKGPSQLPLALLWAVDDIASEAFGEMDRANLEMQGRLDRLEHASQRTDTHL